MVGAAWKRLASDWRSRKERKSPQRGAHQICKRRKEMDGPYERTGKPKDNRTRMLKLGRTRGRKKGLENAENIKELEE